MSYSHDRQRIIKGKASAHPLHASISSVSTYKKFNFKVFSRFLIYFSVKVV